MRITLRVVVLSACCSPVYGALVTWQFSGEVEERTVGVFPGIPISVADSFVGNFTYDTDVPDLYSSTSLSLHQGVTSLEGTIGSSPFTLTTYDSIHATIETAQGESGGGDPIGYFRVQAPVLVAGETMIFRLYLNGGPELHNNDILITTPPRLEDVTATIGLYELPPSQQSFVLGGLRTITPEPSTFMLLGLGGMSVLSRARRWLHQGGSQCPCVTQ